jgi:hypothetical protein
MVDNTTNNLLIESYKFPYLDLKDRVGYTGYIDFIKEEELLDNNVMQGIDYYNRPFIVIKFKVYFENMLSTRNYFQTFFQRYSNNTLIWMGCGHYGAEIMDTSGGMTNKQLIFLTKLLKYNIVYLTNDDADEINMHIFKFNDTILEYQQKDKIAIVSILQSGRKKGGTKNIINNIIKNIVKNIKYNINNQLNHHY